MSLRAVSFQRGKTMSTLPATAETPEVLSLEKRPFNIGELSEFVHHLGPDVEFVALDLDGAEYGGVTRLQLIELLKLVRLPTCDICNENHGLPAPDPVDVRKGIAEVIRDWWNDGLRKVWRDDLEDPDVRDGWFRDLTDAFAKLAVHTNLMFVRDWAMGDGQLQRVINHVIEKNKYRKGVSFSWAHVVEAAVEQKIVAVIPSQPPAQ
jgi:hypothetical protein